MYVNVREIHCSFRILGSFAFQKLPWLLTYNVAYLLPLVVVVSEVSHKNISLSAHLTKL